MRKYILLVLLTFGIAINSSASTINVGDRGAVGDGRTDNTKIIQNAVNECAEKGGGTVLIPAGKYLIRPIEFRSGVNLHISHGATLLGSTTLSDYDNAYPIPNGNMSQTPGLIWGRGLTDISVTGSGTIDGQGGHENFQFGDDAKGGKKRPKLIYFVECKNVEVSGLNLRNSAYWVQHYEKCEDVIIRGLNIYSHCNHNNDGIDIDSRNVIISDCIIDVVDDAICLKSDHESFCENVTITNCIMATTCNGFKMGTGSNGGFRNITVSNCIVQNASEDNVHRWVDKIDHISADKTVLAGIAIEMVDGGILERVTVSNITMQNVQTPIFIKLGDRKRTFRNAHGILKNVNISNITASAQSLMASSITGTLEGYVENVQISNVQITQPGGGTDEMFKRVIPESEKRYPENRMFGYTLPAAGFFVRHVKDIKFSNIQINGIKSDARPLFYFDDVIDGQINSSRSKNVTDKEFIHTVNSKDLSVDGSVIK